MSEAISIFNCPGVTQKDEVLRKVFLTYFYTINMILFILKNDFVCPSNIKIDLLPISYIFGAFCYPGTNQ